MITQVIDAVAWDKTNPTPYRIVGDIDTDGTFWAYVETRESGEWERDECVSFQRDETIVRDIRFDTEVLNFFAGQGIEPRYKCPTCYGYIPNNERVGAYAGALSRTDNKTEICSLCGVREALADFIRELSA
jgi:hypothetical protein